MISYLAVNGPWNAFTTSMILNLSCSLLLFVRVGTFVLQTTAQKSLSPSQRTSTDWTYSNFSCSAQEHLFIVLHFIVLYICCVIYKLKARITTSKYYHLLYCNGLGPNPQYLPVMLVSLINKIYEIHIKLWEDSIWYLYSQINKFNIISKAF